MEKVIININNSQMISMKHNSNLFLLNWSFSFIIVYEPQDGLLRLLVGERSKLPRSFLSVIYREFFFLSTAKKKCYDHILNHTNMESFERSPTSKRSKPSCGS